MVEEDLEKNLEHNLECAKHLRDVPSYEGRLQELAQAIGYMAYDQTQDFILYLAQDIERQAQADQKRGRTRLADELLATANKLYEAHEHMQQAWNICEPHMSKTNEK